MRAFRLCLSLLFLLVLCVISAPLEPTDNSRDLSTHKHIPTNPRTLLLAKEILNSEKLQERDGKKPKTKTPGHRTPSPVIKVPTAQTPPPRNIGNTPAESPLPRRGTHNYRIASAAAKKKGKILELNHAYLLKFKTGTHKRYQEQLVIGTVRINSKGNLDFRAHSSELTWGESHPKDKIENKNLRMMCLQLHGIDCEHKVRRNYKCVASLQAHEDGKFEFVSDANPEFADADNFFQAGDMLIEDHKDYNIIYNNCRSHVRRLANVAELRRGQDPIVTPGSSNPARPVAGSSGGRPISAKASPATRVG